MITPTSQPQEILKSLTKDELVSWILHRYPFSAAENAKNAYGYALRLRFNRMGARIDELLEQVSQTSDHRRKRALFDETDRLHNKNEAILRAMDIWE